MVYNIRHSEEARTYIRTKIPKKHIDHVREVIELCLGKYLKTPSKRCNSKPLKGTNPQRYRLHISMTYILLYQIDDDAETVIVNKVMGINQAHTDILPSSLSSEQKRTKVNHLLITLSKEGKIVNTGTKVKPVWNLKP